MSSINSNKHTFIKFETKLVFCINGARVVLNNPDPDITLLQYVRSIGLTGTKLGCAEGGCGACTVLLSSYDSLTQKINHNSVNACLVPLCSVEGKHVITIEGIGNVNKPHPVQERIARMHGSQCGFCTPGIVMSLYALLRNNPNPSLHDIEECFDGNLCRCTGYRPILDAAKSFATTPLKQETGKTANGVKKENSCGRPDCCRLSKDVPCEELPDGFTKPVFKNYEPSQELIFPPSLMKHEKHALSFNGRKTKWFRPITFMQFLQLKNQYPDAKIVSGNTEVGIETAFKNLQYNVRIHVGDLEELKGHKFNDDGLLIGANISLTQFQSILKEACQRYEPYKCQVFQAFLSIIRWFAGTQIRNVATPAGNIITGSPISDFNPIFLCTNSKFTLTSLDKSLNRRVVPATSFWTGYRQNVCKNTEALESVFIPFSGKREFVRSYKQAKRRDDDIAIVNAALRVALDEKNVVKDASFAFGGMSGVTVRALSAEQSIRGKSWGDKGMLSWLIAKIDEQLQLSFSAPGGMASYRKALVSGFVYKFWHDVAKNIGILNEAEIADADSFINIIERDVSRGVQTIGNPEEDKKIVGKAIPHISALKQVTGEAIYTDDTPKIHNELYGALVLSQKAHAKILSINASEALKQHGVKSFFSAKDVPGTNIWGPVVHDEEVFASKEVHFVGQPIGLIVANTQAIAQEAARLVKIEYQELPYVLTIEEAIEQSSFFPVDRRIVRGDVDKAMKQADFVFEGRSRIGGQEHFYLETQTSLIIPKPEDNEIEIHASTQNPSETQHLVASVLGISANKVITKVKRLGGGFGGKETRSLPLTLALAVGAWHLRRPIRCMLNRGEDFMISGQRHPFLGIWKIGLTKEGKFLALDLQLFNNAGWSADLSAAVLERAMTHSDNCYYIPNVRTTGKMCRSNTVSNTAFRGFGGPQGMMVTENIVSEVADRMGMSAETIRELNFYKEGQKTHFNQPLTDWHLPEIYHQVKESSDYNKRKQQINDYNASHRWRKRGLALIPTKFGLSYTALHLNQAGALVHIYQDGSVLVSHGGVEMGQGLHTKMLQIAAEALEVPLDNVHLMETSTTTVANASATAASVSSDINGYAVLNACKTLSERLKPYREKHPKASFKEICNKAYMDRINLSANGFYKTPDIGYNWDTNEGLMFFYFTTGVAATEVEIDVLTGEHQILRTDLCMDIGRSLNYAIDVGQIEGAFVQGVGWCTIEEMLYFPNGHVFTKGPSNYKLPGFRDIPQDFRISTLKDVKYSHLKTIHSSKGIGEPPLFLGSSVFFAIRDAIGHARKSQGIKESFSLISPATPERIRMACQDEICRAATVTKKDGEKAWVVMI
ncbi:9601_t:CDS:10 [Paraglomus occultum]|uniref:xanthine dehydrogenase n=1 Tax=Paraglomus occultum TaxID=144539 RepID=A0A9N9A3Z4_9GLOM|nr:9601_t:CDS:10 [Paraglomus occultum]